MKNQMGDKWIEADPIACEFPVEKDQSSFNRRQLGLAYLLLISGIVAGFLIGWWMQGDAWDGDFSCFIFGVVLLVVLKYARNFYLKYESAQMELEQEHDEIQLKIAEDNVKVAEAEAEKATPKAKKTRAKSKASNHLFTSDDFDDTAQGMLTGPVKAARKAKAKVTGKGLITVILKGLK